MNAEKTFKKILNKKLIIGTKPENTNLITKKKNGKKDSIMEKKIVDNIRKNSSDNIIYSENSIKKNFYKIKISSSVYRTLNYDASIRFRNKAKILNYSIIFFSTVAGSISVLPNNLGYLSGSLSFLVSILSVIKNTLQYEEKTQVHYDNYKDYRRLVSQIDEILSSDIIDSNIAESQELYRQTESSYNDILEKTPIFNDEFLEEFKVKNIEFIKAASKSGLIPDILMSFDSIIDTDIFYQYNLNNSNNQINYNRETKINNIIQDNKNLNKIIPEVKKLQNIEPRITPFLKKEESKRRVTGNYVPYIDIENDVINDNEKNEEEVKLLENIIEKYRIITNEDY